jgi:uncharacterized membrane protein
MIRFLSWMLWNLFLAVVPVILAYVAAWLGQWLSGRHSRWLWLGLAPLLGLWLIFLPNSCYLFTEPLHLLSAVEQDSLWPRARHETDAALRLGLWTAVSLCYVSAGALSFALSIRPMLSLARRAGFSPMRWAAPFFLLMALGVYLGRVVRYNSWDLFTRPHAVVGTVAGLTDRPMLLAGIAIFGLFLWAAYVAADIWVDGLTVRWRRWTGAEGGSGPLTWSSAHDSI